MLKWIFYSKVEGPRYTWYWPRKLWAKCGLRCWAEVRKR